MSPKISTRQRSKESFTSYLSQIPVSLDENLILITSPPNVPNVLPHSHIHMSHAGWGGPLRTHLPCAVQSVCKWLPTPSHHVQLAQCAVDTVVPVTFRGPSFLVYYLEAYLSTLEFWLWDRRMAINVSNSTALLLKAAESKPKPRWV
jgi:hypothetical protein